MPTLPDTSIHHESDSEEDSDYVPEGKDQDSDTSEERDSKRPRVESLPHAQEDSAAAKSERQALWAKFQDSVNAPPAPPENEPKRMIKIERRHRFAGEDVVEIVDVPEDSKEAKKWPLWKPPDGQDESATSNSGPAPSTEELPSAAASSSSVAAATQPPPTGTKRPGRRRKPKLQLAELPSAASRKGKKLTTLEKSALDWEAHVNVSGAPELASELETNRRSGGYLEKVEFLERVGDRKNQALEANKNHKRRRG
ncbi:bucentaur or craniofacial development-domain-containing protein [Russula compacta]|nr:bucentaur or craniofacial development-domain-containing protein [Russula compacta]